MENREERDASVKRAERIEAALGYINGIRKGMCPCGYMGTILNGTCWKCGTEWGINQPPQLYTLENIQEAPEGVYVFATGSDREWFIVLEKKINAVRMLDLDPKGSVFGPLPKLK